MNWSNYKNTVLIFRQDVSIRGCLMRKEKILQPKHGKTRYLASDQSAERRTIYGYNLNRSKKSSFWNQSIINFPKQSPTLFCSCQLPVWEGKNLQVCSQSLCCTRFFHSLGSPLEKNLYRSTFRICEISDRRYAVTSEKSPLKSEGESPGKLNANSLKRGTNQTDNVIPQVDDAKSGNDLSEVTDSDGHDGVTPEGESLSIWQRFREMSKRYGKILVTVHVFTSTIWAGIFYYAAVSGVDVIQFLQWLGASEKLIHPFTIPGVGHAAVAYLLYKLFTPFRYLTTIGGTQITVKYLRKLGYIPPVDKATTIRSMVKQRTTEMKDEMKERFTRDPKK